MDDTLQQLSEPSLYDYSTAEAVLQEMDNINIRRNRRSGEVERLRMWTDTEFVSILTNNLCDF